MSNISEITRILKAKDYYEILHASKDSLNLQQIKKHFHKSARLVHPDMNDKSDSSKKAFSLLNEAYDTLSDQEKRTRYDISKQNNQFRQVYRQHRYTDIYDQCNY